MQKATELKPDDPPRRGPTSASPSRRPTTTTARSTALRKAITLRPDDAELHFDLAVVYRRQRKTDEAIAEYQRRRRRRTRKHAKAYYDLGILYSQEKQERPRRRAAFENYLKYGTHEDAGSRKDAEDRLKTFKGTADGQAAHGK